MELTPTLHLTYEKKGGNAEFIKYVLNFSQGDSNRNPQHDFMEN